MPPSIGGNGNSFAGSGSDTLVLIQKLLETNNDVTLAMHKSIVEATAQTNRQMVKFNCKP
jgi:hypothetical protein